MTVNVTNTVGANNTIVLDGSSKIPAFDGSQVTALVATVFTTGTLATARIDVGTTAGKILQLDSNAKIPAISGANLVNAPGPTVSTSDPAIDTNSTLGAKWVNKTSGEVYICTDATTDENVWTNVGPGSGDVAPWYFPGESYGYAASGWSGSSGIDVIDKWPFASDGNATDVGNVLSAIQAWGGASSETYGYAHGGYPNTDTIQKFPFATDANSTDVGNLISGARFGVSGHSSTTHGYATGSGNFIEKYSFSTDGNSADVGDMTISRSVRSGFSEATYGYISGGDPATNVIDRFSFSSDGNATDVGDLATASGYAAPGCSLTYGYGMGGNWPVTNVIERFQFVASANSSDVGNLTHSQSAAGGTSSQTYAYHAGGSTGGGSSTNVINKVQMVATADATDVADLTVARYYISNSQV